MSRIEAPKVPPAKRRKCLVEVEMALNKDQARREARRCLRCDLEFTNQKIEVQEPVTTEEPQAIELRFT